MVFGYVIYTLFIVLVIFSIVSVGLIGLTGNTWTKTGKVLSAIIMMLLGWLLYYIVTSPHRDIYTSEVKGNVTEYTYYNYFRTDSVKEIRKNDEWITGQIVEVRPDRWSTHLKVNLSDGNTIEVTITHGTKFENTIKVKKCYWITTHYEFNGESIYR